MSTFASRIDASETIIDDTNYQSYANQQFNVLARHNECALGFEGRDYFANPLGSLSNAAPTSLPTISRSEWKERVEERERNGALLSGIHKHKRLPILSQARNGFCWAFGLVGAYMTSRAASGLDTIHFSAASLASQIKGGRNQGGWAGEAIEGWKKYLMFEDKDWPEESRDLGHLRKMTEEHKRAAATHNLAEFDELQDRNFDQLFSHLLYGIPCSIGLLWWGHLVFAIDPVVLPNGGFGVRIVNSWGPRWEDGGMAILAENKATADEQYAVRAPTVSNVTAGGQV